MYIYLNGFLCSNLLKIVAFLIIHSKASIKKQLLADRIIMEGVSWTPNICEITSKDI